jgi:hypothetical protein
MQIVRTVIWVLIVVGLLAFSYFNWDPVEVTLWDNLIIETKVPALVITSFLLGLIPMWMLHRGTKWQLNRRISTLENAARSAALSRHDPGAKPPADTAPKTDTLKPADPAQ